MSIIINEVGTCSKTTSKRSLIWAFLEFCLKLVLQRSFYSSCVWAGVSGLHQIYQTEDWPCCPTHLGRLLSGTWTHTYSSTSVAAVSFSFKLLFEFDRLFFVFWFFSNKISVVSVGVTFCTQHKTSTFTILEVHRGSVYSKIFLCSTVFGVLSWYWAALWANLNRCL